MADRRVLHRTGYMNGRRKHTGTRRPGTASVVNTDIITDNSTDIPGIERGGRFTGVTNQNHTAVIVVTVIILDKRIPAVPIRIESLRIPGCFMVAHLVKLNDRIVAAPGPDAGSRFRIRKNGGTVAHYVVFDQRAVTSDRNDTVARHLLYQVIADNRMFARMPVFPAAIAGPDHRIAGTAQDMAILDRQAVEYGDNILSTIDDQDTATTSFFFDQRAVHIPYVHTVHHYISGNSVIPAFYLQSRTVRTAFLSRIHNCDIPERQVIRIENADSVQGCIISYDARFIAFSVCFNVNPVIRRPLSRYFEFSCKGSASFQPYPVTGLQLDIPESGKTFPGGRFRQPALAVISVYGIQIVRRSGLLRATHPQKGKKNREKTNYLFHDIQLDFTLKDSYSL